MSPTFNTNVAFSCAESVLLSSPETTPELASLPFAPSLTRTAGGLKSLAERASQRRNAVAKLQMLGGPRGLAVVQEEGEGKVPDNTSPEGLVKPSSSSRAHRRTSLPALRLPTPSTTSSGCRSYRLGQPPLPMTASLPPSPPESPSVFNFNLPSPGVISPLDAYSHLTPSSRAPWTEIVDFANGRSSTPPYSDEDECSEEGSCTTPTSITSFASVLDKAGNPGYLGLVVPRIEVLPVPQRRAPAPPKVVVPGKPNALAGTRMPSRVSNLPSRRRSSAPTLQQITQHLKPQVIRRSTAPPLSFSATTDSDPSLSTTATPPSRLPPFLLARGARKAQSEETKVAVAPASPALVVPVFKVTPPPSERGEGGKRVLKLLERRTSGGAPKIIVDEPKSWL